MRLREVTSPSITKGRRIQTLTQNTLASKKSLPHDRTGLAEFIENGLLFHEPLTDLNVVFRDDFH